MTMREEKKVNSWKRGLPPGKYYDGMVDDFEIYYSPMGWKWHRRRLLDEPPQAPITEARS
jgi:hypothetical protein